MGAWPSSKASSHSSVLAWFIESAEFEKSGSETRSGRRLQSLTHRLDTEQAGRQVEHQARTFGPWVAYRDGRDGRAFQLARYGVAVIPDGHITHHFWPVKLLQAERCRL